MPTYTNQTLTTLQKYVLARLNETYNSEIPALPSGSGGADTIIPLTAITGLINDVIADLCRTCYPLPGSGTFSLASGSAGLAFIPHNSWTTSDGSEIILPFGLVWNTTQLKYCEFPRLAVQYPSYATDAAATPLYWFRDKQGVGIYPYPSSTQTVTVSAYIVPTMLSGSNDPVPIRADLYNLIVDGVSDLIAEKNSEDDSISPRIGIWTDAYLTGKQELWEALPDSVRRTYFPTAPKPPQAAMQGGQ